MLGYVHPEDHGRHAGLCTGYTRVCTVVYIPGVYSLVYHGGYTPPCVYTTLPPWVYPTHSVLPGTYTPLSAVPGEGALGSEREKEVGMRRKELSSSLRCEERYTSLRRVTPVPREERNERLDNFRVNLHVSPMVEGCCAKWSSFGHPIVERESCREDTFRTSRDLHF